MVLEPVVGTGVPHPVTGCGHRHLDPPGQEFVTGTGSIRGVSFTAVRMAVGRVLLVAGVLILLFIPYLLWGTGLMTAHSQTLLRQQFKVDQHRAGVTTPSAPPQKAGGPPLVAPTVAAPPVGSPVGTIDIPTISVNMVVVEGTGEAQLQQGPGHYPGTPLPGEAGNVAIAGHRTTYLHPFYNLNDLNPGDSILLATTQGLFRYSVTTSESVSPNDVSVVDATSTPELTLTTCNPRYSASQRLVVHASLVASILTHPTTKTSPTTPTTPKSGSGSTGKDAGPDANPPRSWTAAILWGVLVAALITAVWIGARRTRRGTRALVLVGGLAVWLVVVFAFFQSLAPLLPASY
jgi:sortase A